MHIPSIAAVVGGDVVYNPVHMMTAETDEASREDWIGNLDQIPAGPRNRRLGPSARRLSEGTENDQRTPAYLRDFSRVVDNEETVEHIVSAMPELHPTATTPASSGTPRARRSKSASKP